MIQTSNTSAGSRRAAIVPVAVLAAALAAQTASAATVFTSEAAFVAATSGLTTVDFDGIAAPGSFVGYGAGPLTLSGVDFTSNGQMFVIDPAFYGSSYAGGGFLNSDYAGLINVVTATLPGAFTAIGMNYGGLFGGPVDFTFTLSDGTVFNASTSQSIGGGSLDFIGVTSPVGVTSVAISMPDGPLYNAVDNFRFGAAVPEPASAYSAGFAALLCLGYVSRRGRVSRG